MRRRPIFEMYYSHGATDPLYGEYSMYRDYRTGRDYYRYTKDYRSSKDYTTRVSRSFDCCGPSPPPPKDHEYGFLPTYGSYIYESNSRGRAGNLGKAEDCQCNCCDHHEPELRRRSEGRFKSSPFEPDPIFGRQRSRSRRRSSIHEQDPLRDHRRFQEPSRSKRSKKPYEMKVVNRTNGALFPEQKPEFYIAFDRDTESRDVLKLLVGDGKKYQAVVRWDDGVEQKLSKHDCWRDVRKYALYLRLEEAKKKEAKKKKHVHWEDQKKY